MDRHDNYKHKTDTTDALRNRRRQDEVVLRKEKREKLISSKRFRHDEDTERQDYTVEQVCEATRQLQKHGPHRLSSLQTLRKACAQGTLLIDAFFSVENAMQCIVGLLTGSDVELQQEAAWCLTNISAGTHDHALAVSKSAAPYLITYLGSSNQLLQDQCAWALGNLAGDSPECRVLLHAQGVVAPLVKLLQSPVPAVVQSSAFALSNIARESAEITREVMKAGIVDLLPPYLKASADSRDILSEVAWILTYLTTTGEHVELLVKAGLLTAVVDLLVKLAREEPQDGQTATPLLRCLGNICSGPDEYTLSACDNPRLINTLGLYLDSSIRHIVKETLWVLSNMAGEANVAESLAYGPLLGKIKDKLTAGFDIKQEALFVLCNIAWHGPEACKCLVQQGVLQEVVPLLKSSDVELLNLSLGFCEMALRMTEQGSEIFEHAEGVARLEGLEYHSNESVASKANQLLDTYFSVNQQDTEEVG